MWAKGRVRWRAGADILRTAAQPLEGALARAGAQFKGCPGPFVAAWASGAAPLHGRYGPSGCCLRTT